MGQHFIASNSKINRTGALSLYKEVYTKTLNNIENLFNTDKNNSLAKFLVEETPYLNNRKIVNFVRDTEAGFHWQKYLHRCW